MALKKHTHRPLRATGRLPGETDEQWTARHARMERNTHGKWVIRYTEVVTLTDGATDHRTTERSTRETDKGAADRFLSDWRTMYVEQRKASQPRCTFRDVVEAYKTTRAQRYTNTNDLVGERLCEFMGDDPAETIQERRIGELHTWLLQRGRKPGTVRNYLSVALTLLNYAERNGMVPKNSAPRYKKPPIPPSRPHALSQEQEDAVFAAAAAWGQDTLDPAKLRVGLFVCIAITTAQRREAILDLSWDRVNLAHATMDFTSPGHHPKNKLRCLAAPIRPRLMRVLRTAAGRAARDQHGEPTGPVFPSRHIAREFRVFRDTLSMPPWFTPHVFRHTWVTLAWGRGVPMGVMSKITGDSSTTLEKTYAHLQPATVRDALERYLYPDEATA